jgi:multidrug resistance protein MdtO
MTTAAQAIGKPAPPLQWFGQFLKEELAPYPGREALVTRAVVAATIVMILTMVFRMPYGAYAVLYALTISRENPHATVKEVKTIVVAFAVCVLYILAGAMLFLGDHNLRLFWIIATLFLMFYALQVVTNHSAAVRFGYLIIVTIPLWDEHISAERRVEGTLWAFAAISLASVITAVTEVVYAEVSGRDDLLQSIAERFAAVEELLDCYIGGRPVDSKTEKQIARLAMVGTSRLRRFLKQSSYSPRYAEQMGAVLALTGRLVDIAANLTVLRFDPTENDRKQLRKVATDIATIRAALLIGRVPNPVETRVHSQRVPLLHELAATVSMIPAVFTGAHSLIAYASRPESGDPPSKFLVADAFSNSEHIKFALKACLAAGLCYLIYNAKDWPGINTAITTCFLTALSTVGSSRQKQMLRISGAIIGVVLGIGSQIFILPHLDSIAGFTLLFLAVTIPATWIATSGPRLSYCGVQILIAFYLITLSEFNVQTSLEPGRDRVIGIFLGLLMMWLVFDQLWGTPAVVGMKKQFVSNLRLLAQFAREPSSGNLGLDVERSYALREKINDNLDAVRASADGVVLEFGPSREQNLAWRNRVIIWQTQLRILFLTRIALWKYRVQLPGFELPESVRAQERAFDEQSAKMLDGMADRVEGKPTQHKEDLDQAYQRIEQAAQSNGSEQQQKPPEPQLRTFLDLSSRFKVLATSLNQQIDPVESWLHTR